MSIPLLLSTYQIILRINLILLRVSAPTEGAVDKPKEVLDLSAAIATITSTAKVYSESKLPPSVPVAYKNWVPKLADAPDHRGYFPMLLYK